MVAAPLRALQLRRAKAQRQQELLKLNVPPKEFLFQLLQRRGYSTATYKALDTAYHNKPTALQKASYSDYLVNLVKTRDEEALRECLMCGLSPSPCNEQGESLIHDTCHLGNADVLRMMLADCGSNLSVATDDGRVPLHEVCLAVSQDDDEPLSFDVVQVILERDPQQLLLEDSAGWLALSYVRPNDYVAWNEFLESVKDIYWPMDHSQSKLPTTACLGAPNSRRCPGPEMTEALPLVLARFVSSGQMLPHQVECLCYDNDHATDPTSGAPMTRNEDSIANLSRCDSENSLCDGHEDDSLMFVAENALEEDVADFMLSLDQVLLQQRQTCVS